MSKREILNKEGPYYRLGLKEECAVCENERFLGLFKDDKFICAHCCMVISIDVLKGDQ